jgi:hypothetical protein
VSDDHSYTVLAFVTTTCAVCQPVWEILAAGAPSRYPGLRFVVVAPSRSMEDESLARHLTPVGAHLHLGSETWFAYGVAQAGTLLLVRTSSGDDMAWREAAEIVSSGTPQSAEAAERLLAEWAGRAAGAG